MARIHILNWASRGYEKKAAFRKELDVQQNRHFSDLIDPRLFYCLGSHKSKIWEDLSLYLGALKAAPNDEAKQKIEKVVLVSETTGPGGKWYQIKRTHSAPSPNKPGLYSINVFSPNVGFNPVKFVMFRGDNTEEQRKQWKWKMVDGIFIPEVLQENAGSWIQRKFNLEECILNQPLNKHQFDYQGLGMTDGDLVVDKIENVVYNLKGEKLQKLGSFGDKHTPPAVPNNEFSPTRWWFILGNSAFLVFVLIFIFLRKRQKTSGA